MRKHNRLVFGVIAAQVSDIEQREILEGIICTAQKFDIDIAVISNIYNPNEPSDVLKNENAIYELISSETYDGLILISEAIINTELQQQIKDNLLKNSGVPIIVVGTELPDFVLPNFQFINTSDAKDMEDITNHLISVHGFTEIAILSGHEFLEASHLRVAGYRFALEQNGISFDEKNVFFGDFWLNSGKSLAERYCSGELKMPQAIVCANDYMAYGLMDELLEHDVRIPEDVTVVGYEYIRERHLHTPTLTTYQRNRKAVGMQAVQMLINRINGDSSDISEEFSGTMITGNSCTCGVVKEQLREELKSAKQKQTYDFLNLFSQLEHRLTECQTLEAYIQVCRSFKYLIRNVQEIYLCLLDDWYEKSPDSETISCHSILKEQSPVSLKKHEIFGLFSGQAGVYYFNPIFFSDRTLGFVVLRYNTPDVYDHIFRNWLKSISNGLEFLRMKNDIQYLTQCQNLSEERDLLTGMYNAAGMQRACLSVAGEENARRYLIALKIGLFRRQNSEIVSKEQIASLMDVSEAVREFCGSNAVCGRIEDNLFCCLQNKSIEDTLLLSDKMEAILMQHKVYMEQYGAMSFACCAVPFENDHDYETVLQNCMELLQEKINQISLCRMLPNYKNMLEIRNTIYMNPNEPISTAKMENHYSYSLSYLRSIYKKCFNISFHQDCINGKITRAKYLLTTTSLHIADIAERCGYEDEKYFLRQFSSSTGFTPNQYRVLLS